MKSLLFTGLVAAATISSNVSAGINVGDSVVLSRINMNAGRAIRYSWDGSRAWDATTSSVGQFGLAGYNNFRVIADGSVVQTFCVEMSEGFPDDPIDYAVVEIDQVPEAAPPGPMNDVRVTLMQDLFSRYFRTFASSSGDMRRNYGAALQLAIWEVSHENLTSGSDAAAAVAELDISRGAMIITDTYNSEVASIASSMLASLGDGGFQTFQGLLGLTNPNNQDMLIVVPTPAIAGLAGLGLVGMRRRRR